MHPSSEPGVWSGDPEPAATVVLVRRQDHHQAEVESSRLEVLLLERNPGSVFAPSAFVFPGGKLEPNDSLADWEAICDTDDASVSSDLGIDRGGLAYLVAAVRECYEECGVLLGFDREPDRAGEADSRSLRFSPQWMKELSGGRLLGWGSALTYLGRRITPPGPPRRFDTRFFVADCSGTRNIEVDGTEIVSHAWLRADQALAMHAKGEMKMLPPTLEALSVIGRASSIADIKDPAGTLRL